MKPIVKILLVGGLIVGGVLIAKKMKAKKTITVNPTAGKTIIGNNTARPKTLVTYSTGLNR